MLLAGCSADAHRELAKGWGSLGSVFFHLLLHSFFFSHPTRLDIALLSIPDKAWTMAEDVSEILKIWAKLEHPLPLWSCAFSGLVPRIRLKELGENSFLFFFVSFWSVGVIPQTYIRNVRHRALWVVIRANIPRNIGVLDQRKKNAAGWADAYFLCRHNVCDE
ncbi:hypothetical protein AA313_de0205340 [Arthrobotrys entomopaga]|nr:hypothetical protein AA313_de0205340 [Arthrobotrys entomopaga]